LNLGAGGGGQTAVGGDADGIVVGREADLPEKKTQEAGGFEHAMKPGDDSATLKQGEKLQQRQEGAKGFDR